MKFPPSDRHALLLVHFILTICFQHAFSQLPTNTLIDSTSCKPCTDEQWNRWKHTYLYSQGVSGLDVFPVKNKLTGYWTRGDTIGLNHKNKYQVVSRIKQTLCGQLKNYKIANIKGAEFDWNLKLKPTSKYRWMSDEAADLMRQLVSGDIYVKIINGTVLEWSFDNSGMWMTKQDYNLSQWPDYSGTTGIKGEITVDQDLRDNEYFPIIPYYSVTRKESDPESIVEGQQLCMYGPFVLDKNHDYHPEIHPSELLWWREKKNDKKSSIIYLWFLQDDSNRFDRESDFANLNRSDMLAHQIWSRPWSAYPRWNEFRIAFKADVKGDSVSKYRIEELYKQHLTAWATSNTDSDDGSNHELKYNGRTIVTVDELQDTYRLGVTFEDVCKVTSKQSATHGIIGYVAVNSAFGTGDRGGEGYHVLKVDAVEPEFLFSLFSLEEIKEMFNWLNAERQYPKLRLQPGFKVQFSPLRVVNKKLVTDLSVFNELDTTYTSALAIESVSLKEAKTGKVSLLKSSNKKIEGVPALIESEIAIDLGTKVDTIHLPEMRLALDIDSISFHDEKTASISWTQFSSKVKISDFKQPPGQLVRGSQQRIKVRPFYGPVIDSIFMPEEENGITEQLNKIFEDATHGKSKEFEVLHGKNGFKIDWEFKAFNVTDGESVKVKRNGNNQNRIIAKLSTSPVGKNIVTVQFPNNANIYKITLIGSVADQFDNKQFFYHTLWSNYLTDTNPLKVEENLLKMAISIKGAKLTTLKDKDPLEYPKEEREIRAARLIYTAARLASQDGRLSIDELKQFEKIVSR